MNLLTETLEDIKTSGHTTDDVAIVKLYRSGKCATWDEFVKIANFEYDNGWGSREINSDLVVVFNDSSWLERREYDGSEWWSWSKTPSTEDTGIKLTQQDLLD